MAVAEGGDVAVGSGAPSKRVDPYVGKTVDGRYFVERVIGEGGMGVVYRGRHKVIDKKVALKILRGDVARDGEIVERFLQEARAASTIGNPHIIDIADFGTLPDGAAYIVMEYLDGISLAEALKQQGTMTASRLVHIARQMAQGLSAAHKAGIVHRDLKPDNVFLITRGGNADFVKILDFGIAKVGGEASRLTRAGTVFGTPHYMSPEQAAGEPVDARTDVYALGIILYELAYGKVPFDADNFMGILTQHMYRAPVPLTTLVPDFLPGLDAVILKLLAKRSEARYQTMDELVIDLDVLEKKGYPRAVADLNTGAETFQSTPDYFGSSVPPPLAAGATPIPAVVPPSRLPLFIGVALVTTVLLTVIIVLIVRRMEGGAEMRRPVDNVVAAPTDRSVVVITQPLGAHVSRDGVDLGPQPIVKMPEGTSVTVEVSHVNYITQQVTLDGTTEKVIVELKPLPPEEQTPPPKPVSSQPAIAPIKRPVVPAASATVSGRPSDVLGDPWRKK
ncbi:protein kinase domain-containing protein [Pendulispora albinea]|uniref:Serine/threonine protein kinase n=1 Tax=Pendulispora albinea TaxID=2741071 RepID=A0ABZ2LN42_9BACT